MHDSKTLAFSIKGFVDVWHDDPKGDRGYPCGKNAPHWRWHVHHWKVNVTPWLKVRRWLFTRCDLCKRRFPMGYCPIGVSWHRPKPKAFQGEPGLFHEECLSLKEKSREVSELRLFLKRASFDHVNRGGTYASFIETIASEDSKPEGVNDTVWWKMRYDLQGLLGARS
jgi:hypothetical protein